MIYECYETLFNFVFTENALLEQQELTSLVLWVLTYLTIWKLFLSPLLNLFQRLLGGKR